MFDNFFVLMSSMLVISYIFSFVLIRTKLFRTWSWKKWFNVFLILNVLDIITTYPYLSRLGFDWHGEFNPLARDLFINFGFWKGVIIGKFLLILFLYLFLNFAFKKTNLVKRFCVCSISVIGIFVILNNLYGLYVISQ